MYFSMHNNLYLVYIYIYIKLKTTFVMIDGNKNLFRWQSCLNQIDLFINQ